MAASDVSSAVPCQDQERRPGQPDLTSFKFQWNCSCDVRVIRQFIDLCNQTKSDGFSPVQSTYARVFRSDDGAIAPIAALGFAMLLVVVGGGIDVGRANSAHYQLQKSLDAAVILAAGGSAADRIQRAQRFFETNFHVNGIVAPAPSFTENSDGSVTGSAAFELDTTLLKVVGIDSLPVVAKATAVAPPPLNMEIELTALAAQGAFAKDIFVFMRNSGGQVIYQQKVPSYDFDGVTRTTTPPLNQVTARHSLSGGSTFGVMMRVYEDLSYLGRRDVNYVDHYSDDTAPRIRTTGSCDSGQTHHWEDGGDSNYADFVYLLRCFGSAASSAGVRLTN